MTKDEQSFLVLLIVLIGTYTWPHSTCLRVHNWEEEGNDISLFLFFHLLAKVGLKGVNHFAFQCSSSSLFGSCFHYVGWQLANVKEKGGTGMPQNNDHIALQNHSAASGEVYRKKFKQVKHKDTEWAYGTYFYFGSTTHFSFHISNLMALKIMKKQIQIP